MRILYIVSAMFPYGWAYAARARTIAKLISECGHTITVMSDYLSDDIDWISDNYARYGKINIVTTSCLKASQRRLIDKLLVPIRVKRTFGDYIKKNHVDCIICDQITNKYLSVKKIAKEKNIPFILEVREWYSYKNWKYGILDIRFWTFLYCWHQKFPNEKNIICISKKLEKLFDKKFVNSVRIPAILDTRDKNTKIHKDKKNFYKLVFIGGINGGKDELFNLIEVICENDLPFYVEIYGPSETDILNTVPLNNNIRDKFKKKVHIHGFINQQLLKDKIVECDYGIIIRPKRRSSDAGFPTKLGEYLAAGLPVIVNDTSDICLYIKNRKNGFILQDNSKKSILNILNEICMLTNNEYKQMSDNAYTTAINYFDYRNYITKMDIFLKEVLEKRKIYD